MGLFNRYKKLAALILTSGVLILSFNNCSPSNFNSSEGNPAPVAPETPPGSNSACTQQQLNDVEAQLYSALQTVTTDVDFSIRIESEDGRQMNYNRGSSTMDTVYRSASSSKWVSATTILSYIESPENLASAKPLTLTSRPQDFISSTNWPIDSTDTLYNIQLRDLLSFTSGLVSDAFCVTPGNGLKTFVECVKDIANANKGNGKVPGAEFFYGSSHLQVAGLMAVEARNIARGVSNSTWHDLFNEFKARTSLFPTSVYDLPSTSNPRLAGGMHWTGTEYFNFVKAYYFNQIYNRATPIPGQIYTLRQLQMANQVGSATIGNSPVVSGIHEDWRYGFGMWLECHATTFNCSTVNSFSSPGLYGAYPFFNIKDKYFGMIAREGDDQGFRQGYAIFAAVAPLVTKWATKTCD